jgi:hypothetical protein
MQIFFGGPEDVKQEIRCLVNLTDTLKTVLGILSGTDPSIAQWGKITPNYGKPQDVIFQEVNFSETATFIFVFWHRFGSPPDMAQCVSPWRVEQNKKNPKLFPSTSYQSGTEAEIETAFRIISDTDDSKRRRVMVYRCVRPLPIKQLDGEQWQELNKYFKHRLDGNVLYHQFTDLAELEAAYSRHIISIAERQSDRRGVREARMLRGVATAYRSDRRPGRRAIHDYVASECEDAAGILESMQANEGMSCQMRTTNLYERIVESIKTAKSWRAIDLDIKRWNELVNDRDRLYTINYSDQICFRIARRVRERDEFRLQRIFAIRHDYLHQNHDIDSIISILSAVLQRCVEDKVEENVENRVFFDEESLMLLREGSLSHFDFVHTRESINHQKDIALWEGDDGKVLYREDITLSGERKTAFETWGELCTNESDIRSAELTFQQVWDVSFPINEATVTLARWRASRR